MYALQVVTPEKMMLSEDVVETIAPGSEGYLGVLAGHTPLLTALVPGEIRVLLSDGRTTSHIVISGGIMEVTPKRTTILADAAERSDEIDLTQAEKSLEEARQLLASTTPGTPEAVTAKRSADLQETRVRVARSR